MTTTERLAQTNLFANKSFYNALDRQSLPSSNAIATPMGFNPETGVSNRSRPLASRRIDKTGHYMTYEALFPIDRVP
jgi:hypothetical protein